jgi:AraC-like DNA-binding protein
MAGLGGRPTKLTQDIIDQAIEYLDNNDALGPAALLPTIERLSLILKVHRDTLYEWAATDKRFSDIFERLKASQADKLLQNGLANRWNPTITKLILSKHDYVEKKNTDITTNGKDLPVPILGAASGLPANTSDTEATQA